MIWGSLTKLFKPSQTMLRGHQLYCEAVEKARMPVFYTELGVADTLDGRFDLIALHVFLLSRALQRHAETSNAAELNQAMIDSMFTDMDRSLREMGVGDVSIGKKVQKMAYALNGRMQAYEQAWDTGTLHNALQRNLYRQNDACHTQAKTMVAYCEATDKALSELSLDALTQASWSWPSPVSKQAA